MTILKAWKTAKNGQVVFYPTAIVGQPVEFVKGSADPTQLFRTLTFKQAISDDWQIETAKRSNRYALYEL